MNEKRYLSLMICACVGALFLVFGVHGLVNQHGIDFDPEWLGGVWLVTPYSDDPQNGCGEDRCVEWCDRFQGGIEIPSGELCCVPPSQVGTEDPRCTRRPSQ